MVYYSPVFSENSSSRSGQTGENGTLMEERAISFEELNV